MIYYLLTKNPIDGYKCYGDIMKIHDSFVYMANSCEIVNVYTLLGIYVENYSGSYLIRSFDVTDDTIYIANEKWIECISLEEKYTKY